MDFINGFPKLLEFKSILVIVDQFSKYAVFVPASYTSCINNVVKYFGLPKDIISDIDGFTRKLWVEIF